MLQVPSHLKGILVPREDTTDTEIVEGRLRCKCESEQFQLMYPGQTHQYEGKTYPCTAQVDGNFFFLIKAVCNECSEGYLVFDKHFHGWDGFVCHDTEEAKLSRPPLVPWRCLSCGGLFHKVMVEIAFQSKEFFVRETGGKFDEDRWPDAFQWIWISITCCKCSLKTEKWVDYETA